MKAILRTHPSCRVLLATTTFATAALVSLLLASCGASSTPDASRPTPTAPTKAAEPTKAPPAPTKVAEPTKAVTTPTKGADFPARGKAITLIIPFGTGGATDVAGRVLASELEKELGTPVQVVNKAGASSQIGLTELASAKPDGYTVGCTNLPTSIPTYIDPERKATYSRDSFQPVAGFVVDPGVVAVKDTSAYKTMKNLVDVVKANPEKVKVGSAAGLLSMPHLAALLLEKAAGVKFAMVQFDGGGAAATALLGDHVDAVVGTVGVFVTHVRSGKLRILGVMDKNESEFLPGVKTMEAQGYDVHLSTYMGVSVPKDTPKEIVDILSKGFKKAALSDELAKKMRAMGMAPYYMDPVQYAARWTEMEAQVKPLMLVVKR